MPQITLEIKLKNGVNLSKAAHVETLKDLGRFLGAGKQYVRMVQKLVPEFAAEKLEKLRLSLE